MRAFLAMKELNKGDLGKRIYLPHVMYGVFSAVERKMVYLFENRNAIFSDINS